MGYRVRVVDGFKLGSDQLACSLGRIVHSLEKMSRLAQSGTGTKRIEIHHRQRSPSGVGG
jgi:hypothetical protein